MRIALISDIHGYMTALEAVLQDAAKQQVEQFVCLGDIATLGPSPRQVLARLQEIDCLCINGNHETVLNDLDQAHTYLETPTPWLLNAIHWCAAQLLPADFDYLRSFQDTLKIPLGAQDTLFCFHGSPRCNTDFILASTPPAELDDLLAGHNAAVMACGHTHIPLLRRHKDTLVINPGSVGAPFEQTPFIGLPRVLPWAEYAILDWSQGALSVDLRRIRVDLAAIRCKVDNSDMPKLLSSDT